MSDFRADSAAGSTHTQWLHSTWGQSHHAILCHRGIDLRTCRPSLHMTVCNPDRRYTLMVSGTGHAGMEASIANLVEPGDTVVVGNAGIWGERVAELCRRYHGVLHGLDG